MTYIIKSRFYANDDCFGESYVITSDNKDKDTRLEMGSKVKIIPIKNEKNNSLDQEKI